MSRFMLIFEDIWVGFPWYFLYKLDGMDLFYQNYVSCLSAVSTRSIGNKNKTNKTKVMVGRTKNLLKDIWPEILKIVDKCYLGTASLSISYCSQNFVFCNNVKEVQCKDIQKSFQQKKYMEV